MRRRAAGWPAESRTAGSSETSQPSCARNSLKLSHSMVRVSRKNSRILRFSSAPKAGGPERFQASFSAWKMGFGCGRWNKMVPRGPSGRS